MRFLVFSVTLSVNLLVVWQVSAHGRLIEPPSRASMWRYGFNTPHDYNDHECYCGGFTRQWQRNKGKCGICGDSWDSPTVSLTETSCVGKMSHKKNVYDSYALWLNCHLSTCIMSALAKVPFLTFSLQYCAAVLFRTILRSVGRKISHNVTNVACFQKLIMQYINAKIVYWKCTRAIYLLKNIFLSWCVIAIY